MQRRQLLRYAGASIVGVTAGGTIVAELPDTANAAVSMQQVNVAGESVTTQDGTIQSISLAVDGSWRYNLPSGKNPETWTVTLAVSDGESEEQIAQTGSSALYLQNNGSFSLSGTVTDTSVYPADAFNATPDGTTTTESVGVVLRLVVENTDGNVLASATHAETGDITVTNQAYNSSKYGSVSGSGSFTVTK